MTHLDELLSVYLDGETTPPESARVQAHLSDCLRCRRRLMAFNDARTAVRSLPTLEMPLELVPAPAAEVRRRRATWLGAAAAAAALIAVASLTAPTPEPIDLSDLSRQIRARAALDAGASGLQVVLPTVVSE